LQDWGEIFIGCAGGGDSKITLDLDIQPVSQVADCMVQVQVQYVRAMADQATA
jgi:hypothetical protein